MKRIVAEVFSVRMTLCCEAYAKKNAESAAPTLPSYFTLPANFGIAGGGSGITFEDFGEPEFYQPGRTTRSSQRADIGMRHSG